MALRRKIAIIIAAAVCGSLLLIYGLSRIALLRSYEDLERNDTRRNLERASNALDGQLDYLTTTVADWAHWDDSYIFVEDGNTEYREANLTDDTFVNLNLSLVLRSDQRRIIQPG
jgi:sensor domain CHASE-containing protein